MPVAKKKFSIAKLKHRVFICTMDDIVMDNGTMLLRRETAYSAWAMIEQRKTSMFAPTGYQFPLAESRKDQETHRIYTRFRRDIDISSAAWIYEERLQSGSRWFKILESGDHMEEAEYFKFVCRLVERGDDLVAPVAPKSELADEAVVKVSQRPVVVKL